MLYSRDMDADTAMVLLHLSKEDFVTIIKKLLENEMLHYTSFNIIELTEIGLAYINKKDETKNNKEPIEKEIKK
jgi:predicted DNA-binding protein with PD1-like motif